MVYSERRTLLILLHMHSRWRDCRTTCIVSLFNRKRRWRGDEELSYPASQLLALSQLSAFRLSGALEHRAYAFIDIFSLEIGTDRGHIQSRIGVC